MTRRQIVCSVCGGRGVSITDDRTACWNCNGVGSVWVQEDESGSSARGRTDSNTRGGAGRSSSSSGFGGFLKGAVSVFAVLFFIGWLLSNDNEPSRTPPIEPPAVVPPSPDNNMPAPPDRGSVVPVVTPPAVPAPVAPPLLATADEIRARCIERYLEINRTEPRFARPTWRIEEWCTCTARNLASVMSLEERRLYDQDPEGFYMMVQKEPTPGMAPNHPLAPRVEACTR
jgi:hypothetical protein